MLTNEELLKLDSLSKAARPLTENDVRQKLDSELSTQRWANARFFIEWLEAAPKIIAELQLLRGQPIGQQREFKICVRCKGYGFYEGNQDPCADCKGFGGQYV